MWPWVEQGQGSMAESSYQKTCVFGLIAFVLF